jgi:hypothetical protein
MTGRSKITNNFRCYLPYSLSFSNYVNYDPDGDIDGMKFYGAEQFWPITQLKMLLNVGRDG